MFNEDLAIGSTIRSNILSDFMSEHSLATKVTEKISYIQTELIHQQIITTVITFIEIR